MTPKPCRRGLFIWPPTDMYIGVCLAEHGEFSECEVKLLEQLVEPGDTVVDVGAHIGTMTVPLSQFVGPTGRVLAFEPQPYLCGMLETNLSNNRCSNVTAHLAACGARSGTISVPILIRDVPNNFGSCSLDPAAPGGIPLIAIDDMKLPKVRLMKVDVEGMETDVLVGARATINRCRPFLYVENDRPDNSGRLLALIWSLGYRTWWHIVPLVEGTEHPALKGFVSFNVIGVPSECRIDMAEFEEIPCGDPASLARAVS